MKIIPTQIEGVYRVELEPMSDSRGFFCRVWCEETFRELGLESKLAQCNMSFNEHKGTTRGMHYQSAPYEEVKLVRCIKGSIFDVAIDLRPQSPTYKQWVGAILSEENRYALYIPKGCAHGFQTLEDQSTVFYQVSTPYTPSAERGLRWDDSAFQIEWPIQEDLIISDKDRSWDKWQKNE